jgi:arylamine N-acetyltransferase
MENSGLFYIVLKSLGFTVYATGGRVSRALKSGIADGGYDGL